MLTFVPGGTPPGPNIAAAAGLAASSAAGISGRGCFCALSRNCPGGTPKNANVPSGFVIAVATSNSDSLTTPSPGTTSRIPRFAIGPSGPTAVPLTRDVGISRSWKLTSDRSSPDLSDTIDACAGTAAPG